MNRRDREKLDYLYAMEQARFWGIVTGMLIVVAVVVYLFVFGGQP